MNILDPISLPLNQSVLIEASAGTGKTYTMANLYLRLILGVGCEPLSAEQILVVTFTKAATQELRDRIRAKLSDVAKWFQDPDSDEAQQGLSDPFLQEIYQQVQPELTKAILRLRIAERDVDLAAIFTIDSFCQKMLFQYAFNSGVRFDVDLQANESELLTRLSEETWRELFYPADLKTTETVSAQLGSPAQALRHVRGYLHAEPAELTPLQQQFANTTLAEFHQQKAQFIAEVKAFWQKHGTEMVAIIDEERNKAYPKGVKKALSRRSYTENVVSNSSLTLNQWAESNALDFPEKSWQKYEQSFIASKMEEGADAPLTSPLFEQTENWRKEYEQRFVHKEYAVLLFSFLHRLREKLSHHKATHKEKSFDDMTAHFHAALLGENGEAFAKAIRTQFKFAMIDEFQDTSQKQYEIFSRIFMPPTQAEKIGFIMIGDPKQSIYKFRNADIFSYLNAANQVELRVTMERNWRSAQALVENSNRLFGFENPSASPFLYREIAFHPVKAKTDQSDALFGTQSTYCHLLHDYDEQQAAERCAYEIQQQLKQAAQGKLILQEKGEKRPLEARDITLLVRKKSQADLLRRALWQRKIPSIYLSARDSVFGSPIAPELLLLLKACLNPYSSHHLLNVLASSLWQFDANTLYQLKQNDTEWENWVGRFIEYQKIWQHQGILPMLHAIFLQEGIIQRLNQQDDAERLITDLLHLTELLQEAMQSAHNENALLHWFQQQIDDPDGDSDEQKLRLESEQKLVKIVTIHGSKGLEYPVVWLPFAGMPSKEFRENVFGKWKTPCIYRNDKHERCWAFSPLNEQERMLINQEEFAEDLRLFYVAVTRAKYQLNLILPSQFSKKWSVAGYLLSHGKLAPDGGEPEKSTADYLADKQLACEIIEHDAPPPTDDWQASEAAQPELNIRTFQGHIHASGQITSFTALQAQHERLQNNAENRPLVYGDSALDYDRDAVTPQSIAELEEPSDPFSPYQFPHSTQVGNLLHKFFERWDFSHGVNEEAVAELCHQLDLGEHWISPVSEWFRQIIATPFADGICLSQLSSQKRLNEWQFYLRLQNEKALPQLNRLLKTESHLAKQLPDLQLKQLEGYVRGFVDMIVQADGKFYVIDYKSNFLGYLAQDYSLPKIEKVMGQYRYDLQYLLYTLAVHRYLGTRLGENYDYERDFGGVAYLFLRGMNGEANSGIYFDKPSKRLIEEMDQLFG